MDSLKVSHASEFVRVDGAFFDPRKAIFIKQVPAILDRLWNIFTETKLSGGVSVAFGSRFLFCCLAAMAVNAQQPTNTGPDSGKWLTIHQQEERRWAKKEKLSVTAVRKALSAAGLKRDGDFYIENLDAHTLVSRRQVLLSTWESGTGKCLAVHILERNNDGFKEVWSAAGAGQDNFCSPGVCGGANAYATLQHVIIQIPLNCDDMLGDAEPEGEIEMKCVRFSWQGSGYELAESTEKSIPVARYKREIRHCAR